MKVWLIKTPKGKITHVGVGSKSQAWEDASDNYGALFNIYVESASIMTDIKDAIPLFEKRGYTCTRGYVGDDEL